MHYYFVEVISLQPMCHVVPIILPGSHLFATFVMKHMSSYFSQAIQKHICQRFQEAQIRAFPRLGGKNGKNEERRGEGGGKKMTDRDRRELFTVCGESEMVKESEGAVVYMDTLIDRLDRQTGRR